MPSTRSTRRQLLAGGSIALAAAVGGCADLVTQSTERSPQQLELSLSERDGPLRERFVVDLAETDPPWDEEAFEAALRGESFTTRHHTPFLARGDDDPTYTRHDGTYYHLDSVVVGEETVTNPVVRLYEVGRVDELDDPPEYVSQSSLPQPDERAVQIAYFVARARGDTGGVPWEFVERGGYVYRQDEAIAASALLADDGPGHVEVRDTVYEVSVSREEFHEAVYRPDVDPVADQPAEMETILRADLLTARLSRETISEEQQEILRSARGEGYRESHPFSEAYEDLLKALDQWPYLDGDVENDAVAGRSRHLLLYGDRYFAYRVSFVDQ